MFGGDLPSNDAFTLSLLNNKDVLRMHEEGTDVKQLFMENGQVAVTSRNSKTGERYIALFNIGDKEASTVTVNLKDLGLSGKLKVKDLWSGKTTTQTSDVLSRQIAPHASVLVSVGK